MKNCKSFERQLTAYLHGELKASDVQALEKHLEENEALRAELEARRATLQLLGETLEAAPAPTELKPWWKLQAGIRSQKTVSDYWYSPRFKAVLASGAIFSLLFIVSMNLVVFQVLMKREAGHETVAVSFEPAPQVERPKMALTKPKMSAGQPKSSTRTVTRARSAAMPVMDALAYSASASVSDDPVFSTEQYDLIVDNAFLAAMDNPLSTFSIDVDRAAYANVRRFLSNDQLPPLDAVRIEEMVNYFEYDYPQPSGDEPFLVSTEVGECPWNPEHQLALIGLQGLEMETSDLPPNNLVFLLDVSGSMNSPDKLPLLKSAMRLLVDQLRPEDRVSIVVYAGAAGVVLEPTADKSEILAAIKRLNAGGSTAGGAGIELAYKLAKQEYMRDGNNRVVLATDGDFNVGASSDGDLVRLIEEKRKSGVYLTVLGFGSGNLKDAKMEMLADRGNGNYAYIDDILEAKKVLVNEMGGTLVTIAKDVKVQIEFNPKYVKGYRLIGYENRMLAAADFDNDLKDAGELGAGHTVTALYELIPAGSVQDVPSTGKLKYQKTQVVDSDELMTVKLRYKNPDEEVSREIRRAVAVNDISAITNEGNLAFASAVAEFGMLLRDSEYRGNANYEDVLRRAKAAKGTDDEGYRAEFIRLVERAQLLDDSK